MKKLLALLSLFALIISCQQPVENTAGLYYPMAVGNSWNYSRTITFENFSPDTVHNPFPEFAPENVKVRVDRRQILNGSQNTYVVQTSGSNFSWLSEDYYVHNIDGLFIVAYNNVIAPPIYPKHSQKIFIKFKGKIYNNIDQLLKDLSIDQIPPLYKVTDDSIIYEREPVQTLKYPLSIGSQWTYRQSYPWHMAKKVENIKSISVPAGNFDCYEIKWLYDMNKDGSWDDDIFIIDYVANEGLIQREITTLGNIATDEQANEMGTFDYHEIMVLTQYHLQNGI